MVHAARASVNRAVARFIPRPARRRRDGSAASKGSATAPPSTRHLLIAGEKILKTELTPSVPTPNAFLIAGVCATFSPAPLRALLIGTPIRLEIDLTHSQQTRKHFLIGTIRPTFTSAPLFTHHSSLITRHCLTHHRLTSFLFDTNKPHKIIILASLPMKTKEKQFSIRYKWSLRGTGNPACALRFSVRDLRRHPQKIKDARAGLPVPPAPRIANHQSPITNHESPITTQGTNAPCLAVLVVLTSPAASGPNWFARLGMGA